MILKYLLCYLLACLAAASYPDADSLEKRAQFNTRDAVPAEYIARPYYPTPNGGWIADWKASYAKASAVVGNMTLAEKVNLTTGTGYFMGPCVGNTGSALRFGIPNLCLQDSALGVDDTDGNTAFPAGITTGATWDKELMYQRGAAIGAEDRGKGVNINLGPTIIPLGRKPRGGRNWESFGADPVLQAMAASQHIQGLQAQGVVATAKHAIAYEQEQDRGGPFETPLSANVDDRTLHELYLWPFAEAIRAGVGAIMTSYNMVNGSAAHANSYLINGLLKDELGFQGLVMCDWLSQNSGVAAALAGLDMAMPGDTEPIPLLGLSYWAYELSTSVLNGSVPLSRLNDMVTRIVAVWYQFGQDSEFPVPNFSSWTNSTTGELYPGAVISPVGVVNQHVNVQGDHANISRAVARDSTTLLKNADNILPLSTNTSLKVFGTDQAKNPDGINSCSSKACDEGTLGMGWGSGTANFPYMDDPISAIQLVNSGAVSYNTDTFPSGLKGAAEEVAIVFINADSGEGSDTVEGNPGDRTESNLYAWHNGDQLVQDAAAAFSTVIVVVHTVGPILLENWIDLPSVKGVLFAHLPGQEAGASLTDVLFGDYSPSGHLPYSIPKAESDYPSSVGLTTAILGQAQDTFSEGLYIDYRFLNKNGTAPRYPFGFGLSYTNFSFSNPSITAINPLSSTPPSRASKGVTPVYSTAIPPAGEVAYPANLTRISRYLYPYLDDPYSIKPNATGPYPYPDGYSTTPQPDPPAGGGLGGNNALWDVMYNVSVTVTNTGSRSGRAVAQLYLQYPASSAFDTPVIQLRDFAKTATLDAGASQTVEMTLTRKDVSVWDVVSQNWIVPEVNGAYGAWIGQSSGSLDTVCWTDVRGCLQNQTSPVAT
ncbi:MAG: hypothetical protein M1822_000976 [Bathelium mastoideum]|nr:MAG: hypothetical protein M1822_000976 [Bathelium mastoideum]